MSSKLCDLGARIKLVESEPVFTEPGRIVLGSSVNLGSVELLAPIDTFGAEEVSIDGTGVFDT